MSYTNWNSLNFYFAYFYIFVCKCIFIAYFDECAVTKKCKSVNAETATKLSRYFNLKYLLNYNINIIF